MANDNRRLAERVEVFTRATSDALQKAVGDVLDARNPWQLLHRLSRIVLLGLVLYCAWMLITLQPDLARRMSTTTAATLQEQVAARQPRIQMLLRSAIEANRAGLHTLVLLQWDGGGSVTVLAADGRSGQLGLSPGQQPLLGLEMAETLGHVSLGLCASGTPDALPITVRDSAGSDGAVLLCPVGCGSAASWSGAGTRALLLGLYERPTTGGSPDASAPGPSAVPDSTGSDLPELELSEHGLSSMEQPRYQKEQLLLIARRLGELLTGS